MLDECSQGTFIDEKLVETLIEEVKRKTSITVSTVNQESTTKAYAIDGFVVRCAEDLERKYPPCDVDLPITFTQKKLPMDLGDIPTSDKLVNWTHLRDVAGTLSGIKDIPLGLLIGNNCPKALEPMQVIPSVDCGPYTKLTRLGWCVIGPTNIESTAVHK